MSRCPKTCEFAAMASAASIAHRLGGRRSGHNWHCECPLGCGYPLLLADGENGKLLLHCIGGDEFDQILPALVPYGLFDDDDYDAGHVHHHRLHHEYDPRRCEEACRLYERFAPGTIVKTYLRS